MPWQYTSATILGDKTSPKPGDSITVTLENPDTLDPATGQPQTRTYTWTYDGYQSKANFVNMVKAEIRAFLDHLNRSAEAKDVTEDFRPPALPQQPPTKARVRT